MAQDPNDPQNERKLPWPEESDPSRLAERFEHQGSPEERELGREFSDPHFADNKRLANSFADPNSLDDGRLGKSFEETNSSKKRKKPPIVQRVHKPANRRPLYIGLVVFAVLVLLGFLFGYLIRRGDRDATEKRAKEQRDAKPIVEVTRVEVSKDEAGIAIPGTTIPLTEAFVYGRANGYLKARLVDIGDHVRKGQILAIIDAPDLDAQVSQARQQLAQAQQQLEQQKSQLALATVTVDRYRVLVKKGVFSRQEGDQQEANYASQVANVAAAQRNVEAYRANLQRTIALQSFEYVRAPFSGVITQRNVDVGALISAGGTSSGEQAGPAPQGQTSTAGGTQQAGQTNNSGSSGNTASTATSAQSPGQGGPLFGVADVTRLRVLVSVPEGYATSIHVGQGAQLSFQEYPGAKIFGTITRTADSIDPNTRTMLTEVQVDNSAGKLVPGMYTVVTFPPAPGSNAPLLITGDAIAIRNDQTTVAVVSGGKIHLVPVTLGRDFGNAVEILTGLRQGDTIVTNITDDVIEGAPVQVHQAKSPEQKPQQEPTQNTPPGGSTQYGNQGITDNNLQGQQAQQNQHGQGQKGQSPQKNSSSESKP
jgi:multidrug efflux pump subunit AcrA (membrane-fusion protein)